MAALLPRRRLNATGLGSSPFARHYSGNHCCFLLLRLLRCFSSAGLPPPRGGYHAWRGGLPHSDTLGSPAICASPRFFAACRVLLRLWEPRHPPCALLHFRGGSLGSLANLALVYNKFSSTFLLASHHVKELVQSLVSRSRTGGPRRAYPILT